MKKGLNIVHLNSVLLVVILVMVAYCCCCAKSKELFDARRIAARRRKVGTLYDTSHTQPVNINLGESISSYAKKQQDGSPNPGDLI